MLNHKRDVFDALGIVAVSGFTSHMAAKSPDLRYTIDGSDNMLMDYRTIGGGLGLVAAATDKGTVGRVGQDVAIGAFSSLVSTEAIRRAAEKRAEEMQQQQIPAGSGAGPAMGRAPYAASWMS